MAIRVTETKLPDVKILRGRINTSKIEIEYLVQKMNRPSGSHYSGATQDSTAHSWRSNRSRSFGTRFGRTSGHNVNYVGGESSSEESDDDGWDS